MHEGSTKQPFAPTEGAITTSLTERTAPALSPGAVGGLPVPERIGEYRIRGVLGTGGMGIVYDAEQEHPHRRVALKVVRDAGDASDTLRRFERESEALGRLQHPGIAQIYAAGAAAGPHGAQPYFAMERVVGRPLTVYAAGAGVRARLELFAKVCDAVHYAHQRGVIHRDLKPANILVDDTGQPKVLDFGVARLTDADVQGTRATTAGEVVGTLQYMSPEQLGGDALAIDTRCDVYALGMILYELLAGRRPYELTGRQLYEAAHTILTAEPPPLGAVDRRLRGDLETITAKALEKDRERRYASAAGLAGDVRRHLADEPITARPASAAYQLRKLARRNRAAVAGVAGVAVALLAGAGVSVAMAVRARAAERVADTRRAEAVAAGTLAARRGDEAARDRMLADERRRDAEAGRAAADRARMDALEAGGRALASAAQAREEAAKARAVSDFLTTMLASAAPDVAQGRTLTVREVLDTAAARVSGPALRAQPAVRAEVLTTLGRSYTQIGAYDAALRHLDSAYVLVRRLRGAADPQVALGARLIGNAHKEKGDPAAARRWYEEALAVQQRALTLDDDELVTTIGDLAYVTYAGGQFDRADTLYRDALARARRHHPGTHDVVLKAQSDLADHLVFTHRAQVAEPLWRETLAAAERLHGERHPSVARALVGLAYALADQRRFAEAEPFARRAYAINRLVYGERHTHTATALSRLAEVLRSSVGGAAADSALLQSLALWESMHGERHTEVFIARTNVARMLENRGEFAAAESLFARTVAGRRAFFGEASPAVASSVTDLGRLALRRGDPVAAERHFRDANARWRAAAITPEVGWTQALLGVATGAQGRLAEADSLLRGGVAVMGGAGRGTHFGLPIALDSLGGVAVRRGRAAEADSAYTAAAAVRRRLNGPQNLAVAGPLSRLATMRVAQGDSAGAVAPLREAITLLRTAPAAAAIPAEAIVRRHLLLADLLCATGRPADGVAAARDALAPLPGPAPPTWLAAQARRVEGTCLARAGRLAEAEPLLVQAEVGLRAAPPEAAEALRDAVRSLVDLYARREKPAEAEVWRRRLP